ncbi:MAG: DUF4912 domain-containing protein [Elusimicrobiota bacterium]|nr:DUF4912 domain-containing protein [Elusimicrobiota bacterium]
MTSSGHIRKENTAPDLDHKSLPEAYGTTEAILLPRDPNWMFIYWEITGDSKKEACRLHGAFIFQKGRQVIRVHQAAANACADKYFDIPVMHDAKNWYVNVQESGGAYYCEVGLVLPDDTFISLVKTNTVNLPAGHVSDVTDEKWMAVTADFDKLLQLSGVEYIGKGSGEVAKSLAQRWEMLRSVFSRASSWGVGSMSSQSLHKQPDQTRKFWLVADCELILYGATEPDAFVTVSGRKVNLNPDGTFSMRFAFPDGGMDLPVKAVSKDETDSREIDIKVTRTTTTDGK